MPYVIESFNAAKFLEVVNSPTPDQLEILFDMFQEAIEVERESYCLPGDPAFQWGTSAAPLERILADRLASTDWYAGLTNGGAMIWDRFVMHLCQCDELGMENELDCEGLSWEFLEEINRQLHRLSGVENASFLAFGRRPYRYGGTVPGMGEQQPHGDDRARGLMKIQAFLARCQSDPLRFQELLDTDDTLATAQKKILQQLFDDSLQDEDDEGGQDGDEHTEYEPAHSIHWPDEISQMLKDLMSIDKPMKQNGEFAEQYAELAKILERLSTGVRAMYVIADT